MKLYEFGKENNKTIMCLPGNFMTHRQFEDIVPLLENDYRIITVCFAGYDETGETTYTIGGVILNGAEYMNYGIFNKLAIDLFAPMTYKLMNKIINSGERK